MTLRVVVNGAAGRMGQSAVNAIEKDPELTLAGVSGRHDNLENVIKSAQADIVVDLTNAHSVYQNSLTILNAGCHPVIGTSGLTEAQVAELQTLAKQKSLGGIVVPNFSIGAVLMMNLAAQAAKFFSYAEIIEYHHEKKADAPSCTALCTAEMLKTAPRDKQADQPIKHTVPGSRGAVHNDIPVHAVRMPGVIAKQQIIFGGLDETLTLEHHSISREAFMPGLLVACKQVVHLEGLLYGLEKILEIE